MGLIHNYAQLEHPPTDRDVTPEELLHNPHWGRCELVDGRVIQMSPAGWQHTRIATKLSALLYNHATARNAGQVGGTDGGFVFPDGKTVRAPDVMFVASERIPENFHETGFLRLVPDFAIEVVSPDDRLSELSAKARSYLDAGVKLVWIVEPKTNEVQVYRSGMPVSIHHAADTLSCDNILPEFTIQVSEIFKP